MQRHTVFSVNSVSSVVEILPLTHQTLTTIKIDSSRVAFAAIPDHG